MRKHSEYGQSWAIAAALVDGPKTINEIAEHFRILMRRFGFFLNPFTTFKGEKSDFLVNTLAVMQKEGWIIYHENDATYELTSSGRAEADIVLNELNQSGQKVRSFLKPTMVSKTTFLVHLLLGAIKLPAALLSGSVSLLNDALDTLMDALSSVIVFWGIRSDREQFSGFFLLSCMIITGGYAMRESISRFISGSTIEADPIAFIAVIISAILSALLWFYQKYAGLAAGSLSILAQSVDSKNHLLVAGGVCTSLIAASLGLPVIDLIVGIAIALMILK